MWVTRGHIVNCGTPIPHTCNAFAKWPSEAPGAINSSRLGPSDCHAYSIFGLVWWDPVGCAARAQLRLPFPFLFSHTTPFCSFHMRFHSRLDGRKAGRQLRRDAGLAGWLAWLAARGDTSWVGRVVDTRINKDFDTCKHKVQIGPLFFFFFVGSCCWRRRNIKPYSNRTTGPACFPRFPTTPDWCKCKRKRGRFIFDLKETPEATRVLYWCNGTDGSELLKVQAQLDYSSSHTTFSKNTILCKRTTNQPWAIYVLLLNAESKQSI